jgi:hypothetical protein
VISDSPVIKIEALSKAFGTTAALQSLTLEVAHTSGGTSGRCGEGDRRRGLRLCSRRDDRSLT